MRSSIVYAAALCLLVLPCRGADFEVKDQDLGRPLQIIAYGDTRFTNPSETDASNPTARRALVQEIARSHPAAILMSGDLPWHGADADDYATFQSETQLWRADNLRIYPALGNHELNGSEQAGLENWWGAFPMLKGRRWYSVQLGRRVLALCLDSNSDLVKGSAQAAWLEKQLRDVPRSVEWVLFNLHHPPVSDFQADDDASHNVRPNEGALTALLEERQRHSRAQYVVIAGHVHNYERFVQNGIYYFVSGGGGAKPRSIVRTRQDLYQSTEFPIYHFLRFVVEEGELRGTMVRLADSNADPAHFDERDSFVIRRH